nr:DUF932 domain-containing protein [Pigmentibacter ruber]
MKFFRANRPLTINEMIKFAPAAFAEKAASDVSKNYSFLSTKSLIETLEKKNILPFAVAQIKSRSDEAKETAKHLIRFRHTDYKVELGEIVPEIVLETSHDAKSSFKFSLGLFRLVCENGLVAPCSILDTIRIKHVKAEDVDVIDAAYEVLENRETAIENILEMKKKVLTINDRLNFANEAVNLRWDKENERPEFEIEKLLKPRRKIDAELDLWTTFNVLQENLVRGGLSFYKLNDLGYPIARQSTRAVNSISKNLELNKNLWTLANKFLDSRLTL